MIFKAGIVSFLAFLTLPNMATADELGRVDLNGREIIINDDNSWSYASKGEQNAVTTAPDGCTVIKSKKFPISVCLDPGKWSLTNVNDIAELQYKVIDKEIYAMILTEKALMPDEQLKKAILINGQEAAGLNKIEILKDIKESKIGPKFGNVVYNAIVDGLDITYDSYYRSFPHTGLAQVIMFSSQKEYQASLPYMNEFIAGVSVEK